LKILVVEDENLLANSIRALLTKKGFEVDVAYDGESGEEYVQLGIYDLLILDIMMPKMNGYELARHVRAKHLGTPILMLTAKSEVEDRITGLNSGADYYLTKPFDTRELLACVNALLRRQGAQVNELTFGNTSLDISTATLICGNERVRLSAKEFDIMRFLLQAGERNLSKETILTKAWGYDSDAVENHVEVYISFLRKKLI
jgi:DNA-binding response OmpR family regulator